MLKREDFFWIRDLKNQGMTISGIARQTGYHRKTVSKYLTTGAPPTAKKRTTRPGKLDEYQDFIRQQITGCPLSAARIYREITGMGFPESTPSLRIISGRSGQRTSSAISPRQDKAASPYPGRKVGA